MATLLGTLRRELLRPDNPALRGGTKNPQPTLTSSC